MQKSLSKKDNDRFALYYLSLVYRDIGRNDLALEVSKKHTSYYPNDKEGYINSSIALITFFFGLKPNLIILLEDKR